MTKTASMTKTAVKVLLNLLKEYTTAPQELVRKRAIALEEEIYLGGYGDSWVFQGDGVQTLRGTLSEYDFQQVYRDMFDPIETPKQDASEEAAQVVSETDDENTYQDEGPDCTGKIHRRFCRKFNREVANDLYWMPWDEVKTSGSYLKHPRHQFGVTSTVTVGSYEGKLVEFSFEDPTRVRSLDVHHIYLGPLPAIPDSFLEE